jgi:hypothetical protein
VSQVDCTAIDNTPGEKYFGTCTGDATGNMVDLGGAYKVWRANYITVDTETAGLDGDG